MNFNSLSLSSISSVINSGTLNRSFIIRLADNSVEKRKSAYIVCSKSPNSRRGFIKVPTKNEHYVCRDFREIQISIRRGRGHHGTFKRLKTKKKAIWKRIRMMAFNLMSGLLPSLDQSNYPIWKSTDHKDLCCSYQLNRLIIFRINSLLS